MFIKLYLSTVSTELNMLQNVVNLRIDTRKNCYVKSKVLTFFQVFQENHNNILKFIGQEVGKYVT